MQIENKSLSSLQALFDEKFGKGAWEDWEPESIMLEYNSSDSLLLEKIFVLKCLNKALNSVVSLPEFFIWTISVCNNEHPRFETIKIPTSLEMAWTIEELTKIAILKGIKFEPSEELIDIISYFLRMEGYSVPVYPFQFIPENKLHKGQTEEDTKMKAQAIRTYIKHMQEGL